MSARLQLQLERMQYSPGDAVKGSISVLDGGASRSLEATLQYVEKTMDFHEVAISIPSGMLHEGDLEAGTSFEFELDLPPTALPNYKTEYSELYWEVDVKSNELGRDTHEGNRIEIALPPPA